MKLRYADRDQEPAEGQRTAFYMNGRLYFLTGVAAETGDTVTFRKREVIAADAPTPPENLPQTGGDTTSLYDVPAPIETVKDQPK
jgi:hypothetical protein